MCYGRLRMRELTQAEVILQSIHGSVTWTDKNLEQDQVSPRETKEGNST